jgi:hypothetical protein
MNTFKKALVAIAAVAALGATVNSAFAGCYESYQPSYGYSAYDNSSSYGYDGSYGWDHHGFDRSRGRFEFRGHDRRR